MKSTGEVMGVDYTFEAALTKALIAAGLMLPRSGNLLFSIADRNKKEALPIIKGFHMLNYGLYATEGTAAYLESQGIKVMMVTKKLGEGHPNVVDVINNGLVAGVVNTITGGRVPLQDGFHIRRAAAERRIPCFTSLDTARIALRAITGGSQIFSIHRMREYIDGAGTKSEAG